MIKDYLLEHHMKQLEKILNATDVQSVYSIYINFLSLFEFDKEKAKKILRYPRTFLSQCDKAAVEAQEELLKNLEEEKNPKNQTLKPRVHIRITAVPNKVDVGQIGELVTISGIVVRMSQPTVIELKKQYFCKTCKQLIIDNLEWERQIFPDRDMCPKCESHKLVSVNCSEQSNCSDYQEIMIQTKCKIDTNICYEVALEIINLDDLIDKCKPGDYVDISGIVMQKWDNLEIGYRLETTKFFLANSIFVRKRMSEITVFTMQIKETFIMYWKYYQDNALVGRDNILASICPQLYGMYIAKLALGVILCGGVGKINETGTHVRGEPHLLLIGDPGTGKSQMLHVASRLLTRSVFTTGIGTSTAGLTATAINDSCGWHLEAGALVLADNGVCCIDEFTTMSSHDRISLHEAMEQQTVSIAKAGMVNTLNSRCSVIAATNPDDGYFEDEEYKTSLENPLLSRFDVIFLLTDTKNPKWDKMTSDHILKAACQEENNLYSETYMNSSNLTGLWKEETLCEYFTQVRTLKPKLTENALKILSAVYLYHRSNSYRQPERTTARLLDSLIRLAEGHAKLMYRTKVEIIDAVTAAELIGINLSNRSDHEHSFPMDPVARYQAQAKNLLKELNLQELESYI